MAELDKELDASFRYAREQQDYWTRLVEDLGNQVREAAGEDEELTINGRIVWHFHRTANFRGKQFAKAYPELAQHFTYREEVEKFDLQRLRLQRPDLYAEFQSRSLTVAE